MKKTLSLLICLALTASCARMPIQKNYDGEEIEAHIVGGNQTARVRKSAGGDYKGQLLAMGTKGRMDLFSKLAFDRMNAFCKEDGKKAKPDSKPYWFGKMTYVGTALLKVSTNDNEFPQMVEWPFSCE